MLKSSPPLACYTIRVQEWDNTIIFLYEVVSGTADRSYGIHVARLAGLPRPVIQRAQEVLKNLQSKERKKQPSKTFPALEQDSPLFSTLDKKFS